ncbi:MAG: hypothetical protein QXI49_05475 [Candidatus Methanomethylicaceae archaeon]
MNPVIVGIIAGIVRTIFGWAKSNEPFNLTKFIRTIIISTITGGILGSFIPDPYIVFASTFTGTVMIEEFLVSFLKRAKGE